MYSRFESTDDPVKEECTQRCGGLVNIMKIRITTLDTELKIDDKYLIFIIDFIESFWKS